MSETAQPKHPILELLARYRAIFGHAWAHRAELAGPARLADELAFLPAALSLQQTPVHPAPRRLAWGLMILFILALVWAMVGEVDIVALAPGRIMVSERTKLIQPLEASVVKRVLVKDGERVQMGQVLVELDKSIASADQASVQEQLRAAASEMQRTRALLHSLSNPQLAAPVLHGPEANLAWDTATRAQLLSEWQDISARLAKLDAESARRQAEIATVRESITKLEVTVPMAHGPKPRGRLPPPGGPGLHQRPRHPRQNKGAHRTGA